MARSRGQFLGLPVIEQIKQEKGKQAGHQDQQRRGLSPRLSRHGKTQKQQRAQADEPDLLGQPRLLLKKPQKLQVREPVDAQQDQHRARPPPFEDYQNDQGNEHQGREPAFLMHVSS